MAGITMLIVSFHLDFSGFSWKGGRIHQDLDIPQQGFGFLQLIGALVNLDQVIHHSNQCFPVRGWGQKMLLKRLAKLFNDLNAVCVGQQAALMKRIKINRVFGEVIFDDVMARHANANDRQAQSASNQNTCMPVINGLFSSHSTGISRLPADCCMDTKSRTKIKSRSMAWAWRLPSCPHWDSGINFLSPKSAWPVLQQPT